MEKKINVMIVDDALMIRAILKSIIEADPQKRFHVIASARDGNDALEKLEKFEIDVITMDIEMPRKNGLEALKEIMKIKPTPVIMFSSLTKKGAKETTTALLSGAVDFMTKPDSQNEVSNKEVREELYKKLIAAASTNTENIRMASFSAVKEKVTPVVKNIKAKTGEKVSNIIAIGCSTGGPSALQKIMQQLPKDLTAAVLIVQHMPPGGYTASLSEHLNCISEFNIKEAEDGDEIIDGNVYIAPGGFHMEVFKRGTKLQLVLNKREHVSGHRPSVDSLFISLSRAKINIPIFGLILTGMGRDGTNGAQALKREGAIILAESEETAVIFGMPKQVIKQGVVDFVENLENIIPKVKELINK